MKRAAAQKVPESNLQGAHSLSADNFCAPAFFCSKTGGSTTYIADTGKNRKCYLRSTITGTIRYIQTGREAEIAARVARILLKGDDNAKA